MERSFGNELLDKFFSELLDSLQSELEFLHLVATGVTDSRKDVIEKHLNNLNSALGLASNIPGVGVGVTVIQAISDQLNSYRRASRVESIKGFMSSLTKFQSRNETTTCLCNIAREAVYRYGNSLLLVFSKLSVDEAPISKLARIGSIRIFYHAIQFDIPLEDCQQIVCGLGLGYEGINGTSLKHSLNTVLWTSKSSSGPPVVVDDFYGKCAYVKPKAFEYEHFIDLQVEDAFIISSNRVAYVNLKDNGAIRNRDLLVPTYGYASLSASGTVPPQMGRHFPNLQKKKKQNVVLSYFVNFPFRYVSVEHVEAYLAYCRDANVDTRKPFREWISFKFSDSFRKGPIYPIFRGTIDEEDLKRKGLSFKTGNFDSCDFSYSTFRKIVFGSMRDCRLLSCDLIECTATDLSFHNTHIAMSRLTSCNFDGLAGFLWANFVTASNSNFANTARLKLQCGEGMSNWDKETLDTFAIGGSEGQKQVCKVIGS